MYEQLEDYYKGNAYKELWPVAMRRGLPKEEYEDIYQETFTRACLYWHTYHPTYKIVTWLSAIMINVVRAYHAQNANRAGDVEYLDDLSPVDFTVSDPYERMLTRKDIRKHIDKVNNESHRKILTRYFIYGDKMRDLVGVDGVSRDNAKRITYLFSKFIKEKYV